MGIAGLSQVPTKEIKITQDACETKDQRRGKTFPNLSSGSTIRSGISDTACVLSWPISHWAVRVLDYPNVSSTPLHSGPVLRSWKTVSTCAEWLGPQSAACRPPQFGFSIFLPSAPSFPALHHQQFRAPSLLLLFQ